MLRCIDRYNIQKLMSTKQVLNVNYKEQQGLILDWNYTDPSIHSTYFRHIIVLYANYHTKIKSFLQKYIKKIKAGDLYSVIYCNGAGKLRQLRWRQKMLNNQTYDFIQKLSNNIILNEKQNLMNQLENQFEKFSEPIIATVYLDNAQHSDWFQNRIIQQRCNAKYDFISVLFGPFQQTEFSMSHKISKIGLLTNDNGEEVDFFLKNVYLSAMLWAKVSIKCLNGCISSTNDQNWRTVSFDTIQREFHGPSIKYQKDFLIFFGVKAQRTYELVVKLQFSSLQRRTYVSEKRFTVDSNGSFHMRTFNMNDWFRSFHATKNIWLVSNPFTSLTIVKFEPEGTSYPFSKQ